MMHVMLMGSLVMTLRSTELLLLPPRQQPPADPLKQSLENFIAIIIKIKMTAAFQTRKQATYYVQPVQCSRLREQRNSSCITSVLCASVQKFPSSCDSDCNVLQISTSTCRRRNFINNTTASLLSSNSKNNCSRTSLFVWITQIKE